jgi:hypothetical protein
MKPSRPVSRSMQRPDAAASHQPIARRRPCRLAAKAAKPKQNTSKGLENEKLCQQDEPINALDRTGIWERIDSMV